MTLPFRLRHHDSESAHDRARALVSEGFSGPLPEADEAWLEDHLARCAECRVERDAYVADRELLRGLRDRMPEPPRDLWARTAAAIEGEALRRRGRRGGLGQLGAAARPRAVPLGVLAGALVVFVVVGTALLPHGGPPINPPTTPGASAVAIVTPAATALVPVADRVAWVQRAPDGSYSLVFADVDHACPASDPTCAPLSDSSPAPLALSAPPEAVVLSPRNDQIAVVGSATDKGGSVLIVTVPTAQPTASAGASPTTTPAQTPTPVPSATATPGGSAAPAGEPDMIISGVTVVGSIGFSGDGEWVAFSARPSDGIGGPDLYLWHTGDDQARRVTTDGATFFSGWYGDLVVASGIVSQPPSPSGSPAPSGSSEPSSEPAASPAPQTPGSPPDSPTSPAPATSPEPSPSGPAIEAHPYSFLLDPVTGVREDFALSDVWLPSIDPMGRFVTYWSGTVTPADPAEAAASGQVESWRPATGHLVLDGWSEALTPLPSASPGPDATASSAPSPSAPDQSAAAATKGPSGKHQSNGSAAHASPSITPVAPADASGAPPASPSAPIPSLAEGPTGTPIELAPGPIADFDARFDPTGRRLAVWVLDAPDSSAGRLWLVVLDPVAGSVDPNLQPMPAPGVQALRGFTIDTGRLAWATPPGQDGQPSSVQVLAWMGDAFGQVESVPGGNPQIVR